MLDFDVKSRGRNCAKLDRPLEPGEKYYSVLIAEGSQVVRYDYASDAWEGPPEKAIGWWKSQVPDHRGNQVHWAPNDFMLHYFEQLESDPEKQDVRFVLALLMVRRRILRMEETDDIDENTLAVYCQKNETTYHVPAAQPSAERIAAIQEELAALLFGDEAPAEADEQDS